MKFLFKPHNRELSKPLRFTSRLLGLLPVFLFTHLCYAQPVLEPWGNMAGIRIKGALIPFETNTVAVTNSGKNIDITGKEKQRPKYERHGKTQIVSTTLGKLSIRTNVTEKGTGIAYITETIKATEDSYIDGVFMSFSLPKTDAISTGISINSKAPISYEGFKKLTTGHSLTALTIRIINEAQEVSLQFETPTEILPTSTYLEGSTGGILIPLHKGLLKQGDSTTKTFTIKASGLIDQALATVVIDANSEGRVFDGFGGNFRLQNPKTDPQVIDYCLNNMRVAWGRVEMPWRFWQAQMTDDPLIAAKSGKLDARVKAAMEMAARLKKKGMPVILSAWSAPAWAVVGEPRFNPDENGVWGNPLDTAHMAIIYKSITDYISYLQEAYGANIDFFSFNESDLGINIRQTAAEHAALIKGLGKYFADHGLSTKMLLGDNSDATTYSFIQTALQDESTHQYIGAVSFHSWRGCTDDILQHWKEAAVLLNKPLIVGEGSIDAQAWQYPQIFLEPSYALEEIKLYTRLLAICQPISILQWQLTADYSPLSGGGIFGDTTALKPTQRFWNLKQLAATPPGLKFIPVKIDKENLYVAALGSSQSSTYVVHFVNDGAARQVNIAGLPPGINKMKVLVTNKDKHVAPTETVLVKNGKLSFMLEETSFVTLTNQQ